MLSLLIFACVHDPPMRPMAELPVLAERGLVFSTEGQALDEVQRVMREAGFVAVDQAKVRYVERALFPVTIGDTITLRRALTDPVQARRHLDEVGRYLIGRPFAFPGWTEDELWEAYQAFFVASLGHELAHVVSYTNGLLGPGEVLDEEARARAVEGPLLRRLAAEHRIPAAWVALYPRFLEALYAELPAEALASIPADPAEARATLSAGYAAISDGEAPVTPVMQAAVARALSLSIGFAADTSVELEALVPAFLPPSDATTRRLYAELDQLAGEGFTWVAVPDGAEIRGGVAPLHAKVSEGSDDVTLVASVPLRVEAKREAELLRLINLVNQDGLLVMVLEPDGLRATSRWVSSSSPGAVVLEVRLTNRELALWLPALERVAGGELGAADAAASVRQARMQEEQ